MEHRKLTIKLNDFGVKYKRSFIYQDDVHKMTWEELLNSFIMFLEETHGYPIRHYIDKKND